MGDGARVKSRQPPAGRLADANSSPHRQVSEAKPTSMGFTLIMLARVCSLRATSPIHGLPSSPNHLRASALPLPLRMDALALRRQSMMTGCSVRTIWISAGPRPEVLKLMAQPRVLNPWPAQEYTGRGTESADAGG